MKSYFTTLMVLITDVVLSLYNKCLSRDKSIIKMIAIFTPVSSILFGYALHTTLGLIMDNNIMIAGVSIAGSLLMFFHDRSLLSNVNNIKHIYAKIIIGLLIANAYTIAYNTEKNEKNLVAELTAQVDNYNLTVQDQFNSELEKLEAEEQELMERKEKASIHTYTNGQILREVRRTIDTFNARKLIRIERLEEEYAAKMREPNIAPSDVIVLQTKKLFGEFSSSSFLAIIMSLIFFLLESMNCFLRLALEGGDYMTRYGNLVSKQNTTRDQKSDAENEFLNSDEDAITLMIKMEIAKTKEEMAACNFSKPELAKRLSVLAKCLEMGIDPWSNNNFAEAPTEEESKFSGNGVPEFKA